MLADLHMHSTRSDGSLEVRELVRAVHAAGVTVFALTDHDTVDGYDEAHDEAKKRGITLIAGVELSTRLEHIELHILGYGFDPEHPGLHTVLEAQKQARHGRIPRLVERLRELGLSLSVDDVYEAAGHANPGRPHVAKALVARGLVRDTDEAFRRYLGDGGPAHIRKAVPAPKDAIAWIHAAGGKAVWAHQLARPVHRAGGFELLLRELAHAGLDGVEEVHPSQDPGARRRIRRLARELELKLTGGSDFHGEATKGVSIGTGRGGDEVSASIVEQLFA